MKKVDITDLKAWYAISCPTTGLRFDSRTLEFLDAGHEGHIRTDRVLAALDYMKSKGIGEDELNTEDPEAKAKLDAVLAKSADLEKLEPSDLEKAAMAEWEKRGSAAEVSVLGASTGSAVAALDAVTAKIDEYFTPSAEMPLVTEQEDVELPLCDHLNPLYQEQIIDFAEKCVKPILGGEKTKLNRLEWKRVKQKFMPYREWLAAKPVMSAAARAELEEEERFLRYRLHLGRFLRNYVTMDELYAGKGMAIFQTGVLRIDGRELSLCFHVDDEAAHSALVEKSKCCVIYLKVVKPTDKSEKNICAVVTAGRIAGLYVGRNGVFYDRDGGNFDAVVTKVVEAQVSLVEAFWEPWRKIGEWISETVKKHVSRQQDEAVAKVQKGMESAQAGGAALASSVAAIGIGMSMVGAAAASVMAAATKMGAWQTAVSVLALIVLVSLPNVILAWFKLRKRDIGAILNASGWAINREMRISSRMAKNFTKCA